MLRPRNTLRCSCTACDRFPTHGGAPSLHRSVVADWLLSIRWRYAPDARHPTECSPQAHLAESEALSFASPKDRLVRRIRTLRRASLIATACACFLSMFIPFNSAAAAQVATAYCWDARGRRLANCQVTITVRPTQNSGGHFHNNNRPSSKVASRETGPYRNSITVRTNTNGAAIFWIQTGNIGQKERFTTCATACETLELDVGIGGLVEVPESSKWIRVGGNTTQHGGNQYNHWMTRSAKQKLERTVTRFLARYPQQGKIAVNDMSLPLGGVFDLGRRWRPPHHNHSYGTAVDVRARTSSGGYSVPSSRVAAFLEACRATGAVLAQLESPGTSNQHIHCEW